MSRPARILARGAIACAGTIIALAAAELLVRSTSSTPAGGPAAQELPAGASGLPALRTVFELAKPNQLGVYRGAVHRTNSAGFRDREYSIRKPDDVFRIVVIGDSVTMGQGVDEKRAYATLLERDLGTSAGGRRYEVLNLGIAGLNLRTSLRGRLLPIGLRHDPDMIVYGFTVNDLEGKAYVKAKRGGLEGPALQSGGSQLLELVRARWWYLRELLAPPDGSYVRELDLNYFENEAAWGAFHDDLAELAGIAEDTGVCGVVFVHTQLHALNSLHPFRRHYRKVASAAEALGLFVVDPFETFHGHTAAHLWNNVLDMHPNAMAHELLAEGLQKGLRALPERCWRGRRDAGAKASSEPSP